MGTCRRGGSAARLARALPPDRRAAFNERIVYTDYLALALPANHPLAKQSSVRLEKVAAEPFVLFHRLGAPSVFDEITALCRRAGFSPKVTIEPSLLATVITLVESELVRLRRHLRDRPVRRRRHALHAPRFGGKFEGRLDILVNNAGTVEFGPFLDSSDDSYDKHFNLNVRSLIELSKDAAKRMIKAGWGRIINIGSAFGEAAPLPGVTLCIATKFAVHGFTRALSRELGSTGVTVNGVQPGPIDTELSPENGPSKPICFWRPAPQPRLVGSSHRVRQNKGTELACGVYQELRRPRARYWWLRPALRPLHHLRGLAR
jgi:NAD(P)-dependent dehydrogenase (short-subunit alcohol dehydrogenase family)